MTIILHRKRWIPNVFFLKFSLKQPARMYLYLYLWNVRSSEPTPKTDCEVVTLPALPCLVLKTEGQELVVEREGRLVASLAIYQLCHTGSSRYKQGQAGKMNKPAGTTVTIRTQLFQLTSAALPLLT